MIAITNDPCEVLWIADATGAASGFGGSVGNTILGMTGFVAWRSGCGFGITSTSGVTTGAMGVGTACGRDCTSGGAVAARTGADGTGVGTR
ncbi:hypothetical protein RBB78_02295 [Tunturiibacter empetritectus]|uniref:hypothetical protein n=1 Tax=Tunturiibacter empetritectus TaxID=3069691 RepID=UPI003D9B6CE7